MRAVIIREFGPSSGLEVVEVPPPTAGFNQVAIRTEAIGVGGVDAVIRRGTLGGFSEGMVPGSEVAGVVMSVGAGVDPEWVGRRVWAFTGTGGGYAEQSLAYVDDLTPLAEDLSAIDSVALGGAATVAHFALAHAHLKEGETVLVRGAAGSIGLATVELAVRGSAGAVAVTTSSAERGRRLREHGATHVLDRSGSLQAGAPKRFDVIIDIVGGAETPRFLDALAPNGRLVLVGAVAGFPPTDFGMSLLSAFQQSRSFSTFSLHSISVDVRNRVRAEMLDLATRRELTPVVHDVLPLQHAADAHEEMDHGRVFGRIVLRPDDAR